MVQTLINPTLKIIKAKSNRRGALAVAILVCSMQPFVASLP